MNCKECLQLIETYLDDELNEHVLSAFEQHLASCQMCRMEVQSFDKCISIMQTVMKDVAPPDTIRERFFRKKEKPDIPLTSKELELVAVGASVAAGCRPCTRYHLKKTREAGASDEEIQQAISDAIYVRKSATELMENYGLKLVGKTTHTDEGNCAAKPTRIKTLVSIAAAFAVNCPPNLEKHLAAAQKAGMTNDDIKAVLELAIFIKEKAASHVDRIAERIKDTVSSEELTDNPGGCGCNDETERTDNEAVKEPAAFAEGDSGCCGDC